MEVTTSSSQIEQAQTPAPDTEQAQTPAPDTEQAQTPAPDTEQAQNPAADASSVTAPSELASDLYALVVFLHKNCNADLFEAMGALELSMTQIKLLHQLEGATRELTLKEAAELVLLSLPAASRTVDDLVRRGMVQRHEDEADRRMKRVSLTDRGRSVIRRLNAARLNSLEQFTQTLTDGEREALAGALKELLRRPDVAVCRPEGN
jgi:DNA-binding MarR family transcriptional regulator